MDLLRRPDTIDEIATASGFSSPAHLIRVLIPQLAHIQSNGALSWAARISRRTKKSY